MEDLKSSRADLAKEYFSQGYNCCTSVVLAFEDQIGMDKKTILKLTSSFGGGMGRLKEVCGAVSGMFMVVGLKYGYVTPGMTDEKAEHYKLIQKLAGRFKEKNGSIICRDLLDEEKDPHHGVCARLVEDAVRILEEEIRQKEQ